MSGGGIDPLSWLLDIGGTATLDSYGPSGDLSLIPAEHFEFLEDCLDYYETDTHISAVSRIERVLKWNL